MNSLDPTTLPALDLTTDGRVIDAATGAIVAIDDPAALPATITDALDAYARAKVEADALAMRINDRRESFEHELLEPALDASPDHQADRAALQAAQQVIAETEAALDGYFAGRADKVSFDTGRVLVTWGKPRETWSLANPPSWYGTDEARLRLRDELHNILPDGRLDSVVDRILLWLRPTAKTSDAPAVKLTVRGEGAR